MFKVLPKYFDSVKKQYKRMKIRYMGKYTANYRGNDNDRNSFFLILLLQLRKFIDQEIIETENKLLDNDFNLKTFPDIHLQVRRNEDLKIFEILEYPEETPAVLQTESVHSFLMRKKEW